MQRVLKVFTGNLYNTKKHLILSSKITDFQRGKESISTYFSIEEVSSDGSICPMGKLEREYKLVQYLSKFIP